MAAHAFLRRFRCGYWRRCDHRSHRLHLPCYRGLTYDGQCGRHNESCFNGCRLDAPQRPEDTACPTPCDDDCDAGCHEHHNVIWRRDHQPEDCPAVTPESPEDARTGVSAEGDGQR